MDGASGQRHRNFLILQGVASRFFARLGKTLEARGHGVRRVNFHAGDWLFGPLVGSHHYRGTQEDWPDYLETKLREWQITDIILFGDCRPLHAAAVRVAKRHNVPFFVFEEGYLRPNWITLELGGTNGYSVLPRDPDWFRAQARDLPEWQDGAKAYIKFGRLAGQDVLYNASGMLLTALYPFYRWHRPRYPLVEYVGWLTRLGRQLTLDPGRLKAGIAAIETRGRPYFLFPLQLEGDTQIREHSPFKKIKPAIESIVTSFAKYAPADALLVVKEHPLDNGLKNWRRMVRRTATHYGIADRVIYLPGGDLDTLIKGAVGVVTINSTVGSRTLYLNRPLKPIGNAIYDIPGLTFQGSLDRFWNEAESPDPALFEAFCRVLLARCLINGNFYSREGIEMAVAGSVKRLEAYPSRLFEPLHALVPQDASPELATGLITDRLAISR